MQNASIPKRFYVLTMDSANTYQNIANIHMIVTFSSMITIMEGLRNAQSITLSSASMFASTLTKKASNLRKCFQLPFNNLKRLSLPHLKLVRIRHFGGLENEVKFVQFLLKSASVLEKMIINVAASSPENVSSIDKTEVMKIGEMLLTSPRASSGESSSVGILFM
ncbi:hypothetical protein IFM89_034662 [Coptis chinensis]|uniref:FBD domain-containing protein n=1 Tax=Coptis chinensis TaxID=261450 RepID=A0A835HU78_9MAGN|nr:hypothetical protein IFM89_034662 [Coptis chinensis]